MKKIIFNLMYPSLLAWYIYTGLEGLYILLAVLVGFAFSMALLGFVPYITLKAKLNPLERAKFRPTSLTKWQRLLFRAISVVVIVTLFIINKPIIGSLYLFTCMMVWFISDDARSNNAS
jgi:hypothetical protein